MFRPATDHHQQSKAKQYNIKPDQSVLYTADALRKIQLVKIQIFINLDTICPVCSWPAVLKISHVEV